MSGVRRIIMGVLGQGLEGTPPGASIAPSSWGAYYPRPGPWEYFQDFTASWPAADGPITYAWSYEGISATGGATAEISAGQGTDTATLRVFCPGSQTIGGGELFGQLVCALTDQNRTVYASALINFSFGVVP